MTLDFLTVVTFCVFAHRSIKPDGWGDKPKTTLGAVTSLVNFIVFNLDWCHAKRGSNFTVP